MLEVDDISAGYGAALVLRGLSLTAQGGEVLAVMGRNGAGKSTLMKAIIGLVALRAGALRLDRQALGGFSPMQIARAGIGYVPQGRRLFAGLTVAENLQVGLMTRRSGPQVPAHVLELFPRLGERLGQRAETLSGGEQQMLAIGRALASRPGVLLLDEPTEGLQPSMISAIRAVVLRLKAEGVAVLLVEQRVEAALQVADRVAFVSGGRIAEEVPRAGLSAGAAVFRRHVGV